MSRAADLSLGKMLRFARMSGSYCCTAAIRRSQQGRLRAETCPWEATIDGLVCPHSRRGCLVQRMSTFRPPFGSLRRANGRFRRFASKCVQCRIWQIGLIIPLPGLRSKSQRIMFGRAGKTRLNRQILYFFLAILYFFEFA